jgi:hypothetical protein
MAKKITNTFAGEFRAVSDVPDEKMWSAGFFRTTSKASQGNFGAGRIPGSTGRLQ